jgi:ATP-dependent RNA helicase DDX56/DBP9
MTQVEGFRYRVEDALRSVTGASVKEARLKDIKSEILNSEKLKNHFEANPKDLHALRHDKAIHPSRIQNHMKHVPDYLLPKSIQQDEFTGNVSFHNNQGNNRKRKLKLSNAQKRRADPLKSFKKK